MAILRLLLVDDEKRAEKEPRRAAGVRRSGNRSGIEDAQVVVEAVLVAVGLLFAAGHVQNEVEDLLPHLSDGCFTGSHAAGGNVDQIEPVLLHLVAAAHLDHRGHVQPVGSAAAGHEHLQADAAGQLAGAAHDVAGGIYTYMK